MVELIAEIGSVHDGSFGNAFRLIELSKEVGATAVKFQMHIAEEESTINAPEPYYFKGENRFDYFKRTSFNDLQWAKLRDKAKEIGIGFIVSPFSIEAFKKLEKLNIDAYKIASGEVTNIPLLENISLSQKPVYLSSGMSSFEEINTAIEIFKNKSQLTLMQCTSMYPCKPEYVGLNVIGQFKEKYNLKIGYSDHTTTNTAALLAVANGAFSIEKHLTFSRKMYGSDAPYASEPMQFKMLSNALKEASLMVNNKIDKDSLSLDLKEMKRVFEKSIVAKKNLNKGHIIKPDDLAYKKPGGGIKPYLYKSLLGKKLKKDLNFDDMFNHNDFF